MADVTGLVMTKLDGTAKGGVLVALADQFGLPIHAIGVGEQIDDLAPSIPRSSPPPSSGWTAERNPDRFVSDWIISIEGTEAGARVSAGLFHPRGSRAAAVFCTRSSARCRRGGTIRCWRAGRSTPPTG
jgi:hypothetical protein